MLRLEDYVFMKSPHGAIETQHGSHHRELISMGCRGRATGFSGAAAQNTQQGVCLMPREGENLVICDGRGAFPEPEEPRTGEQMGLCPLAGGTPAGGVWLCLTLLCVPR